MDWTFALFPLGGGLGQSVITTVWIGIMVVGILNLRFGFPLTGLVVPGYLTPLLIVNPISAFVILIEAILVYFLMRFLAKQLMEQFGFSELFGRDRFFAIILLSILVRIVMDMLFWPILANTLSQWDITFDYSSQLYSLGLVIIALTANVMWNGGFRYGMFVTLLQLIITFILVRYGLMEWTNFSIANLSIMYEAVAASIIAAPKAYIILVITAFLASRANIKYGWEFNGIMLPALLALQLMEPSKLLTSFIETGVILLIGGLLLNFTRMKHWHFEGARLMMFFFNIGFAYKLLLNNIVAHYFPALKVTDTFAFGYMLSTLLALKIYQKNALGLILRATFQTSVVGGAFAILIGFLIMFIPSLFTPSMQTQTTVIESESRLEELVNHYKSNLYTVNKQNLLTLNHFEQQNQLDIFKLTLARLMYSPNERHIIDDATKRLRSLNFRLIENENYLFIIDNQVANLRGFYVINKASAKDVLVTSPYPNSERIASDSATALFRLFNAKALALGTQNLWKHTQDSEPRSPFYNAFLRVVGEVAILQIREQKTTIDLNTSSPQGQYWIYNQIPDALSQREFMALLGPMEAKFGIVNAESLPWPNYEGHYLEAYLSKNNYGHLLAQLAREPSLSSSAPLALEKNTLENVLKEFESIISAKGSDQFKLLTHSQAALWENDVLVPLLELAPSLSTASDIERAQPILQRINSFVHSQGYKLVLLDTSSQSFLIIRPQNTIDAKGLGQGMYVFGLGARTNVSIQIPRPLLESNTLKFSANLFETMNAKSLLIAGAHPFTSPIADVMAPDIITSLFNVVHQSTLRYLDSSPLLNIQVRSHSAPSSIRPNAIAYANTLPKIQVNNEVAHLNRALHTLGVTVETVTGQMATRGLEIGTSPQTGYQLFSEQSELATLWLSSDYKAKFATDKLALAERLLSLSQQNKLVEMHLQSLLSKQWQLLSHAQQEAMNRAISLFQSTQNLGYLNNLCEPIQSCKLTVVRFTYRGKATIALNIIINNSIAAIYLPAWNLVAYSAEQLALAEVSSVPS
ncbi:hypothetical protein PALB_2130 [Pseudoalteromonas luteoviolacea B = ATCC 29581]|nr:hypothetical protein PALB_2130 [Pseudoalteromonas luteoviolacea B = ATCC 29581]